MICRSAHQPLPDCGTGYAGKVLAMADKVHYGNYVPRHRCPVSKSADRSIIDIGGQTARPSCVDDRGQVANFAMNDKCAAGTGRFLEVMAGSPGGESR